MFMDQHDLIGIHQRVTLIVYIIVNPALACGLYMGLVSEMKPLEVKFRFRDRGFSLWIEVGEDQLVFPEYPVDAADGVVGGRQAFVVIAAATVHATEFLVGPAPEGIATLEAFAFVRHKKIIYRFIPAGQWRPKDKNRIVPQI